MNKKPLIVVSILAVVLLVLGSLSNVVGYQSVKKTTIANSPLFQTRTQRATDQQQNIITSQFLGNDKRDLWQIPMCDSRAKQLKKAIDIISKMDDKTFERFTEVCVQKIQHDKSLKDTNTNEIVKVLRLIKTKPISIINTFIKRNNQDFTLDGFTLCIWFPGCIPALIFTIIIMMIILTLLIVFEDYPRSVTCDTVHICPLGNN